jgi:hypothetical protein
VQTDLARLPFDDASFDAAIAVTATRTDRRRMRE